MGGVWTIVKWVLGSILVLMLVVGGAGVFLYPQVQEMLKASNGRGGAEVRVLKIEPGRLVRTITAPGQIAPVRDVQISSRISAQIEALPFEEGDMVRAGDIVVKLDDRDLQASLGAARAALGASIARLAGANALFVNAESDWERYQSLFGSNDVSKAELDTSEAEHKRARSELQAAEQNVEAARSEMDRIEQNLRYAEIRTPIEGHVTKLNAKVGEVVVTGTMNNAGTVILQIADLSELVVKAEVDENDIAPVREGQTARIHVNAYPNDVFEGVVKHVALQHTLAADRSKYYETEVHLIPKDDRVILSGLTANVDIEVEILEDVMLAPSQAVLDMRVDALPTGLEASPQVDRNKTFARIVYRNVDGRAIATPVTIGQSDLQNTAILAGLNIGDEIVVGPWAILQTIKHEDPIRSIETRDETTTPATTASQESDAQPSPEHEAPDSTTSAARAAR